ncbi:hypothetical protein CPK_ORF00986 [Chlamydia pneumoniae LPCoLN]|nr:hypothetical protein CPK_ORF00986 [Chlamydia pneumoniae LPCoLN]
MNTLYTMMNPYRGKGLREIRTCVSSIKIKNPIHPHSG